jgi:hypothetical protein
VHPADFGRGEPRLFDLPHEWNQLERRYAGLGPSPPLDWVFGHVRSLGAARALLEHQYLDRDYRDEYRQFYAQTYRWIPDRCERLHFWSPRQRYLGYTSLRPIAGRPVGRTMLAPGPAFEEDVSCVALTSASPYGHRNSLAAFPYISQDRQYGRCAHAVIWMIAHYHHLRYGSPQRFMSEIVEAAASAEYERVIPSEGLSDDQVGAALRSLGLGAVQYPIGGEGGISREDLDDTLRRYLNSGMPLALATPGHLTVIIGAGYERGELQVIGCDDEHGVYVRRPVRFPSDDAREGEEDRDTWEMHFVPLPGRIYVPYEEIAEPIQAELGDLAGYIPPALLADRPIRLREYVVEVRDYKARLRDRGLDPRIAEAHAQVPSARWLWVCEVQDAELAQGTPRCVLGEIAVDATSDRDDLIFLFANLPCIRASWPGPGRRREVICEPHARPRPYLTGTALNL